MTAMGGGVVVGVDGSEHSMQAAFWAAGEAKRRSAPLHVIIVNDDPVRADYAEKALQESIARCRDAAPQVELTEEAVAGHPAEQLLRHSQHADLVVTGSRGHGGFADALLGSISASVAMHGACPVVVVRGTVSDTGPVVVGVDNSPGSTAALRFGFDTAGRDEADLLAVQVWQEAALLAVPLAPADRDEIQKRINDSLTEQMTAWSGKYPGVRLRTLTQHGHPVAVLADTAREARLLVVGHRGREGFEGLFLGSVASGVLHHAPCPVAVVPRND